MTFFASAFPRGEMIKMRNDRSFLKWARLRHYSSEVVSVVGGPRELSLTNQQTEAETRSTCYAIYD